MEELITVNGQQYKLNLSAPLTQAQRNEVIKQLSGTPGCSSCGGSNQTNKITSLATGCPTSPIPVGTTKQFTINNATGVGPFVFTPIIGGVRQTSSPAVSTFPYTIPGGYTFNTAGSFTVVVEVDDACLGSSLVGTDSCTSPVVVEVRRLASMTAPTMSSYAINVGQTSQATVGSGTDQFGSPITPPSPVTFAITTVPASGVATINSSTGLVTGNGNGTATVTATSAGITSPTSANITVTCLVPTCNFTMT